MYVNFLSTYSDKMSCHTSISLQTSIARFVSDSWASCCKCKRYISGHMKINFITPVPFITQVPIWTKSDPEINYFQHSWWTVKGRGRGRWICIASSLYTHTQGAQVWITQFYLQITPYLLLPRKWSPDGATTDWGDIHLIAAYYSLIDPERMEGWVGLFGWSIADNLPT